MFVDLSQSKAQTRMALIYFTWIGQGKITTPFRSKIWCLQYSRGEIVLENARLFYHIRMQVILPHHVLQVITPPAPPFITTDSRIVGQGIEKKRITKTSQSGGGNTSLTNAEERCVWCCCHSFFVRWVRPAWSVAARPSSNLSYPQTAMVRKKCDWWLIDWLIGGSLPAQQPNFENASWNSVFPVIVHTNMEKNQVAIFVSLEQSTDIINQILRRNGIK